MGKHVYQARARWLRSPKWAPVGRPAAPRRAKSPHRPPTACWCPARRRILITENEEGTRTHHLLIGVVVVRSVHARLRPIRSHHTQFRVSVKKDTRPISWDLARQEDPLARERVEEHGLMRHVPRKRCVGGVAQSHCGTPEGQTQRNEIGDPYCICRASRRCECGRCRQSL